MTPMNYDFCKNWNYLLSHIKTDHMQKIIIKSLKEFRENNITINSEYKRSVYKPQKHVPSDFSRGDRMCMIDEIKYELFVDEIKKNKQLPEIYYKIEKRINTLKTKVIDDDDDNLINKIEELEYKLEKITRKMYNDKFTLDVKLNRIESYIVSGACHWWNKYFCYELAKLACPDETWYVREAEKHTTVINREHTKIFDILYWSLDERLENYIKGINENNDVTLGGHLAYEESN
jgi:hypothetical protein